MTQPTTSTRRTQCVSVLCISSILVWGCFPMASPSARSAIDRDLVAAERFVDAFYSFDSTRLASVLAAAPQSASRIRYYQGWAEGGHYRIVHRAPCEHEPEQRVRCAVTVEDDLIKALRLDVHVTDTFRLAVSEGAIRSVTTSSNDPPVFEEALAWVRRERADRVREPCERMFAGGPTPGACVRAIVQGFAEFATRDPSVR